MPSGRDSSPIHSGTGCSAIDVESSVSCPYCLDSSDEEALDSGSDLSQAEGWLCLLQREMINVLGLPSTDPPAADPDCASFECHKTRLESAEAVFPLLPLDRSCVEMIYCCFTTASLPRIARTS